VWAHALPLAGVVASAYDRLGPVVVAMVESLDEKTRVRELEGNPRFVRFLAEELVPMLRAEYGVDGRIALVGQSLGGLTAVAAALDRPELVEAAAAQSGSFWWPRDEADRPQERLTASVLERPPTDVRIWLETGSLEGPEMTDTARRLRDALHRRGYAVDYREPYGGHDWLRWWSDLPELLTRMYA
jgi:enterochelin esterase family protein